MLSGDQLVELGGKKGRLSLPDLGLKEVFSNGSWLEQKQIQNALEARKSLLEVERIEKCGALSHAQWRDDLKLAEVTQKCGGHWQYLGHNVGKSLFILPEEALLLLETNCLHLKYNDVTVSIQQAYSLLLSEQVPLYKYKVYASLSRLGYKVLRYDPSLNVQTKKQTNEEIVISSVDPAKDLENEHIDEKVSCAAEDPAKEGEEVVLEKGQINEVVLKKVQISEEVVLEKGQINEEVVVEKGQINEVVLDKGQINEEVVPENGQITEEVVPEKGQINEEVVVEKGQINEEVVLENGQITEEVVPEKGQINEEVVLDKGQINEEVVLDKGQINEEVVSTTEDPAKKVEEEQNNTKKSVTMEIDLTVEVSSSVDLSENTCEKMDEGLPAPSTGSLNKGSADFLQYKLDVLCSREVKPCNSQIIHESFNEHLPDLSQAHVIVSVRAPDEKHIPRNVFLNNTVYVLNLESVRQKRVTPIASSSSQSYNSSDDVNDSHMGRIKSSVRNESLQGNWNPQFFPNMRYQQQRNFMQPYWNHFNFTFQRAFFPMPQSFRGFPRMQQPFRFYPPPNFGENFRYDSPGRAQKRKRVTTKSYHLDSIRKLSSKLKNMLQMGHRQAQNIESLQRLIQTFNIRYKAMLQLTEQLDILDNEVILDTINLDDDDQPSPEKRQKNVDKNLFDENFIAFQKLALKIRELEDKNELSPRHRRAFSGAIKTFNKSYDADVYVDSNNEVINRRQIVIASSSESDPPKKTPKPKKSRKLRNPFYIMKQLAEKTATQVHPVPNYPRSGNSIFKKDFKYSETLKNTFGDWLPSEEDFGRAEVVHKEQKRYCMVDRMVGHSKDILFEFMKAHSHKDWLEAKIAYWESCRQSAEKYEDYLKSENSWSLNSIIGPDDSTDMKSALQKLSIIKTNKDVKEECPLAIDFDVYNRNVQNFKKTNKPRPHFRVVCLQEHSPFLSGIDIATLRSKYGKDANIVFAIVGISSVTYLQVNTTDLPICVPTGNGQ